MSGGDKTFKWTSDDVENLFSGSKQLVASSSQTSSSFDDAELLLARPQFLNQVLMEILDQLNDEAADEGERESLPSSASARSTKGRYTKVIGTLKWLLSQSLSYNYNENNETEARLHFSPGNTQERCCTGSGNKPPSTTLRTMIEWFPEFALEQIRTQLNAYTFQIGKISSADDSADDWDVEEDESKRVIAWKTFVVPRKLLLKPVDRSTKGGLLVKVGRKSTVHQRYALKFDRADGIMYRIGPNDIGSPPLRVKPKNVVLTLTFLVGNKLHQHSFEEEEEEEEEEEDNDDDDAMELEETTAGTGTEGGGGGEECILNDYLWTADQPTPDDIRALSLTKHSDGKKFDLFLHGARSDDGDGGEGGAEKCIRIAAGLKTSRFYTVQVKWGAEITEDRMRRTLSSFYAIFYNGKCVMRKIFRSVPIADMVESAFYVGGLNGARNAKPKVVKTKMFTGLLSNLEIMQTVHEHVPPVLTDYIAGRQTIANHGLRTRDATT